MLTPVDVLDRIRPPIGNFGTSREACSVSGSSFSDSLRSPLFRENQSGSSRENRLVAVGDAREEGLNGLESTVSRRRVLGRTADDGELTPKVAPGA